MEFDVLCPRGEVDPLNVIGLQPRLDNLNNKKIGLYATFKEHWPLILDEFARQLQERYPTLEFTRFVYLKDLNSDTQVAELAKDPDYRPAFEEWVKGVDAVIVANADAGSCTLYLTYNATFVEHCGKPVVMTLQPQFIWTAKRAAALRGVPALRFVEFGVGEISLQPSMDPYIQEIFPREVKKSLDNMIKALTEPLTPSEKDPDIKDESLPRVIHTNSLDEMYKLFYEREWIYGMPVMPPTEEAVKEMLTGTDLPPDHVVAKIPPLLGKATVEKIAINAVMAGCLPIHLPVVIAAVEAIMDPNMWLEAYLCSVASWAPLLMINGPIRKDININSGVNLLSPYYRANATIGHALGLIVMNMGGVRSGKEDMGWIGHEGRFGMCIAENEEESPWEPMHVFNGLNKEDSAVTVAWPNSRESAGMGRGANAGEILRSICDSTAYMGFDPGCTIVISPQTAKMLNDEGFSRKQVLDYVCEYARRPVSEINVRWMKGNHHILEGTILPEDPTRSVKKFFTTRHLSLIVAGPGSTALFGGGGDHGGPITKKIELPKNWDELVAKYKDSRVPF